MNSKRLVNFSLNKTAVKRLNNNKKKVVKKIEVNNFYTKELINYVVKSLHINNANDNLNNIVEETNEGFYIADDENFDLYSKNYVPIECIDTINRNAEQDDININLENNDEVIPHIEIDFATIQKNIEATYVPENDPDVDAENEELDIVVKDSTKNSKYTREAQRLMAKQKLTPVEIILLLKEVSKSMAAVVEFPLNKYMDMYRQLYNANLIFINFNEAGIFIYECSEIFSKEVNYAFDLTANLSITKYDDFILPSVKEAKTGKKIKKMVNKPIEPVHIIAEEKEHDVYYINRKHYEQQFELKLPLSKEGCVQLTKTIERKELSINEKYIFYTLVRKHKRLIERPSDSHIMFASDFSLPHGDVPDLMADARIPRLRNRTFEDYFILHATKDPCTEYYANGLHRINSRKVKFIIYLLKHLTKCKEDLLKTVDLGIINRFNKPLVVDELSYQTFLPTKFILVYLNIERRFNNAYSKYVKYEKKVHCILEKKNVGDIADKFRNLMLKTIFKNFGNRKKRKKRRSLRIDKSLEIIDLTLLDEDANDCCKETIKDEVRDNDNTNIFSMEDFDTNIIDDGIMNDQTSITFENNQEQMNHANAYIYKDTNYDRTRLSFGKQLEVKLCDLTANDQRLLNCRLILPNLLRHIPPDKIDINNFSINVNRLLNVNSVYNDNIFNIDKRLLLTETDFKLPNTYFVKDVPLIRNILKLPEKLIKHKIIYKLPDDILIKYKLLKTNTNSSDKVTRNSNYGLGTILNKSNILSSTLMGHDDSGNETASSALQEQMNAENNFGDISNILCMNKNGDLSQKSHDSGIQDDNESMTSADSKDYYEEMDVSYKVLSQLNYDEDQERINHWHQQVAPILEQNKYRNEFDIHAVSKEILIKISHTNKIAALEENCDAEDINNISYKMRPITFSDVIREKGEKNTARYFSSLLQLINFKNVRINNLNKNTDQMTSFDDIEINLLNDVQYFENNAMFSNPKEININSDLKSKYLNKKRKLSQLYENNDGICVNSKIRNIFRNNVTSMNQNNVNNNIQKRIRIPILSNIAGNSNPYKSSTNGSHLSLEAKLCIETSYSITNRYNDYAFNNNRKNKENNQLEISDNSNISDMEDDDNDDDAETYSLRKCKNAKIIETKLLKSPLVEIVKNKNYSNITADSDDEMIYEKSPYKRSYSNKKRKTVSSRIKSCSDSSSRASNSESDNESNVKIKYSPKSYYNKKKRNKVDINADNGYVAASTINRCLNFSNCTENVQTQITTDKDILISKEDIIKNINNDENNKKKENSEEAKFSLFKNYKKIETLQPTATISSQSKSQYQYVSSEDDDSNNNYDTNPEIQQKILDSYKKNKPINSARTSFYDSAYLSCNSSYSSYSEASCMDLVAKLTHNNKRNKDMPGPSGLQKEKK